jgi:septal ring factor EnvC (AmiA/AmiB activator)
MSSDPEFEKRINNKIETILETQANLQESIAGLVQVARIEDERIDRIEKQIEENGKQIAALIQQGKEQDERIAALAEQGKEQQGRIDALIRIVEGHVSNHP